MVNLAGKQALADAKLSEQKPGGGYNRLFDRSELTGFYDT